MAEVKVLKVEAIAQCYVGHRRRKVGQVFQVNAKQFSPNCMKLLEGKIHPDTLKRYSKKDFGDYDAPKNSKDFEDDELDSVMSENDESLKSAGEKKTASDLNVI